MSLRRRRPAPPTKPPERRLRVVLAAEDWRAIRDALLAQHKEREPGITGQWSSAERVGFCGAAAARISRCLAEQRDAIAVFVESSESGMCRLAAFCSDVRPDLGAGKTFLEALSRVQHGGVEAETAS
jgi:Mg2+ and Co2+ transporter CorA